jgi:hypothetical protein
VEDLNEVVTHPIQQAMKYYGVKLTVDDVNVIRRLIRQGRATFAAHSEVPGVNFYFITWCGVKMKFLYAESTETLVTAVPLEFLGKTHKHKSAERKREFFRRFENDEEE